MTVPDDVHARAVLTALVAGAQQYELRSGPGCSESAQRGPQEQSHSASAKVATQALVRVEPAAAGLARVSVLPPWHKVPRT